eukprot:TRINITY_DN21034_c0_g1_i3.p1 TRINITY_DN21034_c0_g1~~TRINITY_DN21034_c0_g1_i3.p1  ORF type:complete len:449 (-),score=60.99 TRINITY_DN21034_c0_g1_i3:125-1471(-)
MAFSGRTPGSGRQITDVWAWNFDAEFGELLAAAGACGDKAVLAIDTEFPGFLREEPASAGRALRYQALRENVDNLRPIQLGVAIAREDASVLGTWSFNLRFDVAMDLHTEASVNFLRAAGLDFPRHAVEGIEPAVIGRRLAASTLIGRSGSRPQWVTFQGWYDFGYLLKLLTSWPLPGDAAAFESLLAFFCPTRDEIRDTLPRGSLDSLIREHGVERVGSPHTAGSDALATLDLFLQLAKEKRSPSLRPTPSSVVIAGKHRIRNTTDWNGETCKQAAALGTHPTSYSVGGLPWDSGPPGSEGQWCAQDLGFHGDCFYEVAQARQPQATLPLLQTPAPPMPVRIAADVAPLAPTPVQHLPQYGGWHQPCVVSDGDLLVQTWATPVSAPPLVATAPSPSYMATTPAMWSFAPRWCLMDPPIMDNRYDISPGWGVAAVENIPNMLATVQAG